MAEELKGNVIFSDIEDYGIAACFDYIADETATSEASITDNYVESNYSVQDHIAIKPKVYRLRGYIGEMVYKKHNLRDTWATRIGNTIENSSFVANHPVAQKAITGMKIANVVSPIVGSYTNAAKNVVNQLQASYERYAQMWNNYKGDYSPIRGKKQTQASSVLTFMLENRIPVHLTNLAHKNTLNVDDNIGRSYYIQSVSSHQGDSAFISDFEVTIKEFRIAKTIITDIDKKQLAGDTASQKTVPANNGTANIQKISSEVVFGKLTTIKADEQAGMSRIIGNEVKEQMVAGQKTQIINDVYMSRIAK